MRRSPKNNNNSRLGSNNIVKQEISLAATVSSGASLTHQSNKLIPEDYLWDSRIEDLVYLTLYHPNYIQLQIIIIINQPKVYYAPHHQPPHQHKNRIIKLLTFHKMMIKYTKYVSVSVPLE